MNGTSSEAMSYTISSNPVQIEAIIFIVFHFLSQWLRLHLATYIISVKKIVGEGEVAPAPLPVIM